MKRALIIGGGGFVGRHLTRHLRADRGWQVTVTQLPAAEPPLPDAETRELDILDAEAAAALLRAVRPDYVFHLAAQASAALSWKKPALTVDVNVKGAVNVLEAVRALDDRPRVLLVGSSEEYGRVAEAECPVPETQELRPGNVYAVTKVCQEMLGRLYAEAYGLEVLATRSFNHIGPGQDPAFAAADFCRQTALIEAGKQERVIRVGNLAARRDFTDVRDVVRAYGLLAERGAAGEIYNVGSGRALAVGELLDAVVRLAKVDIIIEKDPERFRPLDVPLNVADVGKLRGATGWEPEIPLERTLADTLDYWRAAVGT